jgi:hypothetical protein
MKTVISSDMMSCDDVDIYQSFAGICPIQLQDIKEIAWERRTVKPQNWEEGWLWHSMDRIKVIREGVSATLHGILSQKTITFCNSLQQDNFLWTYLYILILALHQQ